jgi:hypothetical protein
MILQLRHIALTEVRTFIALLRLEVVINDQYL